MHFATNATYTYIHDSKSMHSFRYQGNQFRSNFLIIERTVYLCDYVFEMLRGTYHSQQSLFRTSEKPHERGSQQGCGGEDRSRVVQDFALLYLLWRPVAHRPGIKAEHKPAVVHILCGHHERNIVVQFCDSFPQPPTGPAKVLSSQSSARLSVLFSFCKLYLCFFLI